MTMVCHRSSRVVSSVSTTLLVKSTLRLPVHGMLVQVRLQATKLKYSLIFPLGQDNTSDLCIVGDVPNIFEADEANHDGPYDGIEMGC